MYMYVYMYMYMYVYISLNRCEYFDIEIIETLQSIV